MITDISFMSHELLKHQIITLIAWF